MKEPEFRRSELDLARIKIKQLSNRCTDLALKLKETRAHLTIFQGDASYVGYLQSEMLMLEHLNLQQQHVIEQYREHYKRYGHFYQDYEHSHTTP